MSGTFGGIMSIATTALRAQQMAIEVAANNIANAQTEGYTRVRAELNPLPPRLTPQGALGTGVSVSQLVRVRSTLLDGAFRREHAFAAESEARADILGRIEEIFAEPSENGLAATLDRFADAWSDLANNPTSGAAREITRQRGQQVAAWLNGADARMVSIENETYLRATEATDRLNQLVKQIADLNHAIIPMEVGGGAGGPLNDQRDRAIDELSALAGAEILKNPDGSVNVVVAGQTLVDGGTYKTLNAPTLVGGELRLTIGSSNEALTIRTGSLKGILTLYNTDIANVRDQLDQVATAVVHGVNRWHRTGWSAAGDALNLPGEDYDPTTPAALRGSRVDFFQSPPGTVPGATPTVTARDIRLSDEVLADVNVVSAGRAGWNGTAQVPQVGDNAIALAIAELRSGTVMIDDTDTGLTNPPATTNLPGMNGRSMADFWRAAVTDLGLVSSRVQAERQAGDTLRQQTDVRRQGVSGVSIDEELIAITRAQQAYQAAAKVLTLVQELTAELAGLVR
ncbi:MAG: flagellar hook-associated protein FlgK [Gemmatimonadaceae bacterium]|nr:flagellar hook-associated protein FlgK [Gemmatimonadaceae bacterium]